MSGQISVDRGYPGIAWQLFVAFLMGRYRNMALKMKCFRLEALIHSIDAEKR